MQLPKLRSSAAAAIDPSAVPMVPPLADDPDYAREIALLAAFNARDHRRCQEIELLAHEGHFAAKPSDNSAGPRDMAQRARMMKLRALPSYFDASDSDPAPTTIPATALARGLELLRGGKIEPEMGRQERLDRLRRDGLVLAEAIRYQAGVVDDLRAAKSYELCLRLKDHHDAVLLAFFRAAQELSRITDCERAFRAQVIVAGYEVRPDLIGPPFITAPLLLGSEQQHDSQISTYRRHLQERGIVR